MKWLLSLLFLFGCQRYNQWQYHRISETTGGSTRVQYKTKDQVAGIDLEFIRSGDDLATYLQVHGQPLPYTKGDQARVKLISQDSVMTFLADLHTGGQRIRLSNVLQKQLLSLLIEGQAVTIEVVGYREQIDPKRFNKVFKELNSHSSDFLSKFKMSMMY